MGTLGYHGGPEGALILELVLVSLIIMILVLGLELILILILVLILHRRPPLLWGSSGCEIYSVGAPSYPPCGGPNLRHFRWFSLWVFPGPSL